MLSTLLTVVAAGFEVCVAAPPTGPLTEAVRELGVSHLVWSTRDNAGQRHTLEQLRSDLATLFDRHRPDLVHANSLSTARIAGPVAAEADVRSIGHLRDIVKLPRQAVDDLNRHHRLIAVSQATRDFHIGQGIDATRCVTLHNGIDLGKFRPRERTGYLHRQLGLDVNAHLVVTIGQLGLRKGTEVVLAAAAQVANQLADVHWLIVGERTSDKDESQKFESGLRLTAAGPPLVGRVHFLGSRTDVPQLMNECVLLVHGARQEPLGRVLLEAAASGLAVVATDVGGTREIFPTAADGAVLVPPDDSLALAAAMIALLTDEARRASLASAARLRAQAAFDIRLAARQLMIHYQQLLKG